MMIRCAGLLLTVLLCSCATSPKSKFDSMGERSRRWVDTADAYAIEVLPGASLERSKGGDGALIGGGLALFGIVGGFVAADIAKSNATSRGAFLTRQNGFTDPAPFVANGLRTRMGSLHRAVSDDANLHLRIRTSFWGVNGNSVGYSATLQVVSAATGNVVMKGECRYGNDFRKEGMSLEALLANSGTGLKKQYVRAADYCSDYFAGKLFPARV